MWQIALSVELAPTPEATPLMYSVISLSSSFVTALFSPDKTHCDQQKHSIPESVARRPDSLSEHALLLSKFSYPQTFLSQPFQIDSKQGTENSLIDQKLFG
jgi:hypothetical protein